MINRPSNEARQNLLRYFKQPFHQVYVMVSYSISLLSSLHNSNARKEDMVAVYRTHKPELLRD